jgi:citrate synthase
MAAEIYAGAVNKGLEGVVACTTGISSIVDATLCYRGYTIEDLAANANFEEVVYLLWEGKLPNKEEFKRFKSEISEYLSLPEDAIKALQALPTKGVHPMAWLRTAVSTLALWDDEAQSDDPKAQKRVALKLTARMGMLVALFERTRQKHHMFRRKKIIHWRGTSFT